MYGVLMAFQKYYPKLGIFGSKWVGFDNFKVIFQDPYFWTVLLNTIKIGTIKIVLAFLGAVTTALLLNVESTVRDGMMEGYTGNYIRIARPYDPALVNTLVDIVID